MDRKAFYAIFCGPLRSIKCLILIKSFYFGNKGNKGNNKKRVLRHKDFSAVNLLPNVTLLPFE